MQPSVPPQTREPARSRQAAGRGLKRQHTARNGFAKIAIRCQRNGRGVPRNGDVAASRCHWCDVVAGQLGRWVFEDENCRIERERSAEANTNTAASVELADP